MICNNTVTFVVKTQSLVTKCPKCYDVLLYIPDFVIEW